MTLSLRLVFLSIFVSPSLFSQTVHIVSTTDLHGHLLPQIDVMNGYFSLAKKIDTETLFLDSGDLFQGTIISNSHDGATIVKWMNYVGYTASAVGNHEFDFGPGQGQGQDPLGALKKNAANADFKFLSANIEETQFDSTHWFEPYLIKEVHGLKIGIIGLTTQSTPTTTMPANVANLRFTSLSESLEKLVPRLKSQGVQGVVILVHDGDDSIFKVIDSLKTETREAISLILAGHTHNYVNKIYKGIQVLITGCYGQSFGYTTLEMDPTTHQVIVKQVETVPFVSQGQFLGSSVQANFEASKILAQEIKESEQTSTRIVGKLLAPLKKTQSGESNLGDFMTDAFRSCNDECCRSQADIAFLNNGGIRSSSIDAGEVTYGDIFNLMPFDNVYAELTLSGRQIHDLLVSWYSYRSDAPTPQTSGLIVSYNLLRQQTRLLKNDLGEEMSLPDIVDRIQLSNGRELEEDKNYQVVMSDFLATGGGGTGFVLRGLKISPKIRYDLKQRDQFLYYFRSQPAGWDYRNIPPRLLIANGSNK